MAYCDFYSELRVIGQGSFGESYSGTVHLVQSKRDHQRYVAKKILLEGMTKEQLRTTHQEVALLQRLQNPHIVSYIENFTEGQYLVIIMEYCDSGDLSKRINEARDKQQPLTEESILYWLLQCALALEYMHDTRVLHRDIKSSNIFLTRDKTVKLGDFGISRVLEHTYSVALTMVGTPYYMSPEVCESKPYNAKSDVWSLGCVAYELCALRYPFVSANLLGLILKISSEEPAPLPETYSPGLRELIREMLRKDPEERPSITDILQSSVIASAIKRLEAPAELPRAETNTSQFNQRSHESPLQKTISQRQSQDDSHQRAGLSSEGNDLNDLLASQDFNLSVSQDDRSRHKQPTDNSSDDEPFEDLQSQTGNLSLILAERTPDLIQPPKFSQDTKAYESKVASLRSKCFESLGEELFERVYEFIRGHRARETSDEQVLVK
jgi:NIMA (never in mitosis gene a)-related kinase